MAGREFADFPAGNQRAILLPMSPERERWAETLEVERTHGDTATDYIAKRVQELALAGDEAGVTRWMDIAARLGQLRDLGARQ